MSKVIKYQSGFDNEFESEALPGALPRGQFNPQRHALGLYTEQLSSTAFTAPRANNRRTWMYRIRPSVAQGLLKSWQHDGIRTAPCREIDIPAQPLRWDPAPILDAAQSDFVDGLVTFATCGDAAGHSGIAVHQFVAGKSMNRRYFANHDGELLLVPQYGRMLLRTECGRLELAPGEIAVVPRAIKFAVDLLDDAARGYVCENYGASFSLPERGPVGANGFANERDFQYPVAAFEDDESSCELVVKFCGQCHRAELPFSPLDVVAWAGNSAPYKYELARFMAIGSISFDHPDPSIFTVLTSKSEVPGVANVDFVIFPPRWMVAEDTFRPPWFHRNAMSEFMGLVHGEYDAKKDGFTPGGASLHNAFVPHGPEQAVFEQASTAELVPRKLENTLAFMFESRFVLAPTRHALESPQLQTDYANCWDGLERQYQKTD